MCQRPCAVALTATSIARKLGGYPWIAAGDANEEPNQRIAASFTQFEGRVFSTGSAAGLEGKKELDWFSASRPQSCGAVTLPDSIKISDRKMIAMKVKTSSYLATRVRLPVYPRWNKPSFLQPEQWQSMLQFEWQKHTKQSFPNLLHLRPTDIDVNVEWDNFMFLLNDVDRKATVLGEVQASDSQEKPKSNELSNKMESNKARDFNVLKCKK